MCKTVIERQYENLIYSKNISLENQNLFGCKYHFIKVVNKTNVKDFGIHRAGIKTF